MRCLVRRVEVVGGLAPRGLKTVQVDDVDDTEPFVQRVRNTIKGISAIAAGQGGTDHSDRKGLTALWEVDDLRINRG